MPKEIVDEVETKNTEKYGRWMIAHRNKRGCKNGEHKPKEVLSNGSKENIVNSRYAVLENEGYDNDNLNDFGKSGSIQQIRR